jgi:hypothetical protein
MSCAGGGTFTRARVQKRMGNGGFVHCRHAKCRLYEQYSVRAVKLCWVRGIMSGNELVRYSIIRGDVCLERKRGLVLFME